MEAVMKCRAIDPSMGSFPPPPGQPLNPGEAVDCGKGKVGSCGCGCGGGGGDSNIIAGDSGLGIEAAVAAVEAAITDGMEATFPYGTAIGVMINTGNKSSLESTSLPAVMLAPSILPQAKG